MRFGRRCCSEETKKKMSASHQGRPLSEETRRKMSLSQQGRKHSEEIKKKLKERNLGKRLSEETRRIIGEKSRETGKGRIFSEETRRKLSLAKAEHLPFPLLQYYESPHFGKLGYRSKLELSYLQKWENDLGIVSVLSEPVRIKYDYNGLCRTYVPDFIVNTVRGEFLVKDKEIIQAKKVGADRYIQSKGMGYLILTECDLNSNDHSI